MATTDQWLSKLTKLRVDRASGDPAPHKPLLLLTVLEMAEGNELPAEILPLTPELAFQFYSYWNIVAYRRKQRPDIRLPFHHLKSDGFWSALDSSGEPSDNSRDTRMAAMPSDFVAFANDPAARDKARRILIATYFRPSERLALYDAFGMPVPSDEEIERDADYQAPSEALDTGREARFRIQIVSAYNYTCALTGYRLTTITAGSIVDAAHIHRFSDSRNNSPTNGIALSKNAHWQFDQGLWTISDDFRVVVSVGTFAEDCPAGRSLTECHGDQLSLPGDRSLWPDLRHIAWHRRHCFQGQ